VPDEQHRPVLVVGEAGHQRVVVGEAPIAVDFDEVGEEALDEISKLGRSGCRATAPLPGGQRSGTLGAHVFDPAPLLLDLAIARVGARQRLERVDLLQEHCDRLLEFQRFRHTEQQMQPQSAPRSQSQDFCGLRGLRG
jgi:hypothetical protein